MYIDANRLAGVTDNEIITRLKELGGTPPKRNRRGPYLPKLQDRNKLRWVLATEVGYSTRKDRRLFNHLIRLAKAGDYDQGQLDKVFKQHETGDNDDGVDHPHQHCRHLRGCVAMAQHQQQDRLGRDHRG